MCPNRPGTLHDFRSHEIADQLTLLDAELFYKIEVKQSSPFCWSVLFMLRLWADPPVKPCWFPPRSQRYCFGPRSRTKRRVQTWLSSQSTLTTWAIGEAKTSKHRVTIISPLLTHYRFNLLILQGPLFDYPAGESARQREAASQVHQDYEG